MPASFVYSPNLNEISSQRIVCKKVASRRLKGSGPKRFRVLPIAYLPKCQNPQSEQGNARRGGDPGLCFSPPRADVCQPAAGNKEQSDQRQVGVTVRACLRADL